MKQDVRSRWPPEPLPPLPDDMIPFPDRDQRHEWFFFIVGFNRRKINKRSERPSTDHQPASGKEKAWSPSRPMQTSSTVKAPDAMEEDEEEAMMNAPLPVAPTHTNTSGNDNNNDDDGLENVTKDDNEETWDEEIARRSFRYDLEPETAKHRPRAPTISVLSRLSQVRLIHPPETLITALFSFLCLCPLPFSFLLLEFLHLLTDVQHQIITIIIQIGYRLNTQIEHLSSDLSFDPAPSSVPTPSSGSASSTPNPFTSHLCQWSFALLALLDPNLTADDLHHVREFARVIMRVGGWRYLRALQDGEIDAHWVLGQSWATPSDEQTIGQDGRKEGRGEEGVDETLARCWMIVLAIVAGWAQHDLLESLENLFK